MTANIKTVMSEIVCNMPKEMIRVVAPAGGCSTEKRTIKNDVRAIERIAARIN